MAVLSSSSQEEAKEGSRIDSDGREVKRKKCPGVRVVGGRIYDSENGKTCHQCRQKTRDFAALCKNPRENKPCTIMLCHKCLLNRYGEKAEEVALMDDWKCPKCKGICNCSVCMKKRGHKPTGILVHTAKATGFSSVSEMLDVNGPNNICETGPKEMCVMPKTSTVSNKEPIVVSPGKRGKENSYDGNGELNLSSPNSNKTKRKEPKGIYNGSMDNGNNPKKPKVEISENEAKTTGGNYGLSLEKDASNHVIKEGKPKVEINCESHQDAVESTGVEEENVRAKPKKLLESLTVKKCISINTQENSSDISLPQGTGLTTVAGIELPLEDVGHALQFFEFCAAFGEVLGVKKGQAETVIRELIRRTRRSCSLGQYSLSVQFHIQLLSLIQKDLGEKSPPLGPTDGKNSWFQALGKHISKSQSALKELPLNFFDSGVDGYQNLEFSIKLRLLNFLCDEALGTIALRSWIDEQNATVIEMEKEAREKVLAAKDKKRQLQRKLQDDMAKAVIEKGAPLSISEHVAIVSQIKSDTALAHAEILEAMAGVPAKTRRSDAVRTEPIFLDINGCAYWKLKSYAAEPNILFQDIKRDDDSSNDKWFAFDSEQKQAIDKYFSSLRLRKPSIKTYTGQDINESSKADIE